MFSKLFPSKMEVSRIDKEPLEQYLNYLKTTLQELLELTKPIEKSQQVESAAVEIYPNTIRNIITCGRLVNKINDKFITELTYLLNDSYLTELEDMKIVDLFMFMKDGVPAYFEPDNPTYLKLLDDISEYCNKHKLRDDNFDVIEDGIAFRDHFVRDTKRISTYYCNLYLLPYKKNGNKTVGSFLNQIQNPVVRNKMLQVFMFLLQQRKIDDTLSPKVNGNIFSNIDNSVLANINEVIGKISVISERFIIK